MVSIDPSIALTRDKLLEFFLLDTDLIEKHAWTTHMPGTAWCGFAQDQVWDVMLLLQPPLQHWGELKAQVCVWVKKCIEEYCHWIP